MPEDRDFTSEFTTAIIGLIEGGMPKRGCALIFIGPAGTFNSKLVDVGAALTLCDVGERALEEHRFDAPDMQSVIDWLKVLRQELRKGEF